MPLAEVPGDIAGPVLLDEFCDRDLSVRDMVDVLRRDHGQPFVERPAIAVDDVGHAELGRRLARLDREARWRAVRMGRVSVGEPHAFGG